MGRYLIRRIFDTIPTLLVIIVFTFLVTRYLPGDPAMVLLGPQASVEEVTKMRMQLGLDRPLHEQFTLYIGDLLHGDLGRSPSYGEPVLRLILERFPNTVTLALSALLIALIFGVGAGIISAVMRGRPIDYAVMVISLVGVSMPIFWLGIMLVLYFSVNLGWFPAIGMADISDGFGKFISHLTLPAVTLSTIPMATFARITRSSMLDVLGQDYIRTAAAKGLAQWPVYMKHALRNALTPILTILGITISGLLGGSVLTETIFSWPGLGRLIVNAIERRDYMVVQGAVLFVAVIFVTVNLAVDLLYGVVNPRVALTSGKDGSA